MMKKVLVTQRVSENSDYPEMRENLDIQWSKFLKSTGAISVPISVNIDLKYYFNSFDISGIVLTGGNDLFNFSKNLSSKIRDKFEKKLIKKALQKNIPIIGVCRGMQLIAQHFDMEVCMIKNHVGKNHNIQFTNITKNFSRFPKNLLVNSFHNFGVKKIKKNFKTIATASDGSIEAFEHKNKSIIGIMWHPERYKVFKTYDQFLFKTFWK